VIPPATAVGPAVVAVTTGAELIAIPAEIAAVSPGIFTQNGSGGGLAAAQVIRVRPDGSSRIENAGPGIELGEDSLHLVLYGTGIRHRSSLETVICVIAGETVTVAYAGPQGQFPALDQVNVPLPAQLRGAGTVTVAVTSGWAHGEHGYTGVSVKGREAPLNSGLRHTDVSVRDGKGSVRPVAGCCG
jgi:uncharacterized protein (TIGR03437 family)